MQPLKDASCELGHKTVRYTAIQLFLWRNWREQQNRKTEGTGLAKPILLEGFALFTQITTMSLDCMDSPPQTVTGMLTSLQALEALVVERTCRCFANEFSAVWFFDCLKSEKNLDRWKNKEGLAFVWYN